MTESFRLGWSVGRVHRLCAMRYPLAGACPSAWPDAHWNTIPRVDLSVGSQVEVILLMGLVVPKDNVVRVDELLRGLEKGLELRLAWVVEPDPTGRAVVRVLEGGDTALPLRVRWRTSRSGGLRWSEDGRLQVTPPQAPFTGVVTPAGDHGFRRFIEFVLASPPRDMPVAWWSALITAARKGTRRRSLQWARPQLRALRAQWGVPGHFLVDRR